MICPFCHNEDTKVIDSRASRETVSVRRRRHCLTCGQRYTTYERVERLLPEVIKRDGRREPFQIEKVRQGLEHACQRRPIPAQKKEDLIQELELFYAEGSAREVHSREIGEAVLAKLKALDEVAYVRFASVYRDFKDVAQFMAELQKLSGNNA